MWLKSRVTIYSSKFKSRTTRASKYSLGQTSALIAKEAREKIRVRPGSSRAGTPPNAHTRGGLRVINYDVQGKQSVIGPRIFRHTERYNRTIPNLHERGGVGFSSVSRQRKRFPERSFMYSATKRLNRAGKINRRFSVSFRSRF